MRNRLHTTVSHLVLAVFAITALVPLVLVLLNSFKDNSEILGNPFLLPQSLTFDNFSTAWQYGRFAEGFVNSILLTGTTVIVVLVCSALAGYVLAGQKVRTWPLIMVYLTMAMTVPIQLFIFPLYSVAASLGLTDNVFVVGVILAAINMPFATFLMRTFFLNVPTEVEEAALVDGLNTFQLVTRVLLPMVRPGLITVGVIIGLNAWNEFLISSTFLQGRDTKTLTLGFLTMNGTFSTDIGTMMAGALILILPILVVFIALQRFVVDGMASGAVKG
ncbi:carbohydrate ABC transporter permease [Microbacterium esteraromaticum]|uniref:Carbohydrate ABC transporter permease n=1 Tax=Microbacterium esteraromaticum TaxID=57043 RepID=A0A7D7W8C6_9MICO|nr:carbohydrate ABC transporter permease [Microbacterium esteraromaticum]QMU97356.1 carbohydrate ABC transporter permease [Microbacterium esteraromaticum]